MLFVRRVNFFEVVHHVGLDDGFFVEESLDAAGFIEIGFGFERDDVARLDLALERHDDAHAGT